MTRKPTLWVAASQVAEKCGLKPSGVKTQKKTQPFCRAYPSFVRMKRHDPQTVRLFPQTVQPRQSRCQEIVALAIGRSEIKFRVVNESGAKTCTSPPLDVGAKAPTRKPSDTED
jgi:hypothetical protein